ncbi:MAG: hypothetical protein GX422_11070 [Deltaproteobacteria bacterium]|nr:hypothetical protein [Deltaproteobacteria bacterium]
MLPISGTRQVAISSLHPRWHRPPGGYPAAIPSAAKRQSNGRYPYTLLNWFALGQFTPWPIIVTATFAGHLVHGLSGALIVTVAIFLPSFLIPIGIAPWFDRVRSCPLFSRALGGILYSFVGLLLTVTIRFGLNVQWEWAHAASPIAALRLFTAKFTATSALSALRWPILSTSSPPRATEPA